MKLNWQDLPKPKAVFTVRNAEMVDLDKKKIVQYYSANTRINVVQKVNYKGDTYYRTGSTVEKGLNWAFKASAFGLPNDEAPLEPSFSPKNSESVSRTLPDNEKTNSSPKTVLPDSGEERRKIPFFKRIFRRKNG